MERPPVAGLACNTSSVPSLSCWDIHETFAECPPHALPKLDNGMLEVVIFSLWKISRSRNANDSYPVTGTEGTGVTEPWSPVTGRYISRAPVPLGAAEHTVGNVWGGSKARTFSRLAMNLKVDSHDS